jgi:hypothetical protein
MFSDSQSKQLCRIVHGFNDLNQTHICTFCFVSMGVADMVKILMKVSGKSQDLRS